MGCEPTGLDRFTADLSRLPRARRCLEPCSHVVRCEEVEEITPKPPRDMRVCGAGGHLGGAAVPQLLADLLLHVHVGGRQQGEQHEEVTTKGSRRRACRVERGPAAAFLLLRRQADDN